jgi:hypothetical protein
VVIAAGVLCTFGAAFLPIAERKAKTRLVGSLGIGIGLCLESMVATVGTNEPEWHRLIILAGWRFGYLRRTAYVPPRSVGKAIQSAGGRDESATGIWSMIPAEPLKPMQRSEPER